MKQNLLLVGQGQFCNDNADDPEKADAIQSTKQSTGTDRNGCVCSF